MKTQWIARAKFCCCKSLWIAAITTAALTPLAAQNSRFITFDVPGDNIASTKPAGINANGLIAGTYTDTQNVPHGFVRYPSGEIAKFDAPSAQNTTVFGLNNSGFAVGQASSGRTSYGFIRSITGKFIIVNVPGAYATDPTAINDRGDIAGWYTDTRGHVHSFLRAAAGSYSTFDDPNVGPYIDTGTFATTISANGDVIGYYGDSNFVDHGFIRDPSGAISDFDLPGSLATFPFAVSATGVVVGDWTDKNFFIHAFVRDASGIITSFDVPDAGNETAATAVNGLGTIVGFWGKSAIYAGFRRGAAGEPIPFWLPASGVFATRPSGINDAGAITGWYNDLNSVIRGFVR